MQKRLLPLLLLRNDKHHTFTQNEERELITSKNWCTEKFSCVFPHLSSWVWLLMFFCYASVVSIPTFALSESCKPLCELANLFSDKQPSRSSAESFHLCVWSTPVRISFEYPYESSFNFALFKSIKAFTNLTEEIHFQSFDTDCNREFSLSNSQHIFWKTQFTIWPFSANLLSWNALHVRPS